MVFQRDLAGSPSKMICSPFMRRGVAMAGALTLSTGLSMRLEANCQRRRVLNGTQRLTWTPSLPNTQRRTQMPNRNEIIEIVNLLKRLPNSPITGASPEQVKQALNETVMLFQAV